MQAVAEQEEFIRDYLKNKRVREVRLFLAVNYYRPHRNTCNTTAMEYKIVALELLKEVMKRYPGTVEAKRTEALLVETMPEE